ncbi:tetratricopeptide repeat protein [Aquabacterium sp. OR-4]|uniref:tetratricopeptide repeat protein n=1 Tax=Aquabacterium sp. OR-4 TaxID=2978127 RepID=UPI0021B2D19B|nr:tetratricopeptide repeat protein [Aquabacterium sp. OR-4]MDT7838504.1 tetratricopeptide repeat protein [Aquabacterium sp. OR-4]
MGIFCAPAGRWAGCVGVLAGLLAAPAQAQFFRDAALQRLADGDRIAELGQAALARVAARADDAQAVLGLAVAALASNEAATREKALQHAQACIKAQPQAAECQYALGSVLGVHAMSQGMVTMAAQAGQVKEALAEAFRLSPQWYPARGALVEFYLLAPGMLGGSNARAAELARTAPRPEQVRALEGRVALADGRLEQAASLLLEIPAGGDSAVADDMRQWAGLVGYQWLQKDQPAKARPVFERLLRDQPDWATGGYGLGRVLALQGQHAEAVRVYEQVRMLRGAAQLPIDYRLGQSYESLGQAEPARAAYGRYIKRGVGQPKQLDDARKRLALLG